MINSVVLADGDSKDLSYDVVNDLIKTDAGIEKLVSILGREEADIKVDKPFYYHYLSAVKALVMDSDYLNADKQFLLALEQAEIHGTPQEEALAIRGIIDVYNYYGDITKLIEYGSRLLKLGEENNQPDMIISGAYSIAWGHYYIFDDSKVVDYLDMGVTKALEVNSQVEIAQFYYLMGQLTYAQMDYSTARKYFGSAGEQLKKLEQENRIVREMSLASKAIPLVIDSIKGISKDLTIKQINDLLLYAKEHSRLNKDLLISFYEWNAEVYTNYEMTSEAIKNYEKCLELGNSIKHIDNIIDPFENIKLNLAESYYEIGEYEKSAKLYVEQAILWENELLIEKNERDITKVKSLGEQQMSEKINLLNRLMLSNKEKITFQRRVLVTSIIFILLLAVGLIFIILEYRRIVSLKKTLYINSITDSLTQVYNRGKIIEIMEKELLAENVIAIIDIDDFKQTNDTYGHAVGDEVIVKVISTIKETLRATDVLGRYGGDEFILILKQVDDNAALKIIERVRKDIEEIRWPYAGLKITVSIGMVKKCQMKPDKLFTTVDSFLYEAKKNGKNCVVYRDCMN